MAEPAQQQNQPAPQAAIVVRVARTPAQYTIVEPLDFSQRNDITVFKNGCAALKGDKYDGTKLKLFLTYLQSKAGQFNWNALGMLTYGPRALNLLTQYGEITMAQVRAQAEIYQPLLDCRCQNSAMMFQCINASISTEVLAKVSTDPTCYRILLPAVPAQGNQPAVPAEEVEDGPCFLKAIIDDTYANTATNVALARRNLANLREYIKTVPEYNIITFHQYVKEQLQELEVANETTTDLLVNLFSAYREVPDKQFKGYVQPIQDQHYDARQPQNPNGLTLMTTIENYYKGMIKDGIWMKPDADQETIFALKAQIEAKPKPKDGKVLRGRKDWRLTPPKAGESRKKVVMINGKKVTYYWFPHHNRYTVHKPQDCRLQQTQPKPKFKSVEAITPANKKDKKQGLALRVMNAIFEGSNESSSE